MAVTVGVDTYLSVADADIYWSDRNNTTWAGTATADKEKGFKEATQYIDNAYTFIGTQIDNQIRAWPRYDARVEFGNYKGEYYDSDTIPPQIKDACAELALEAASSRLRPIQERGGAIVREKVDVVEVEYASWAPSQKSFDFVNMLVKPLLRSGGGSMRTLIRA